MTSLAGKLPKANGLQSITEQLVAHPTRVRAVIALVDVVKITTNTDTGEETPTCRVRQIEIVGAGKERAMIEKALRRATELRTGQTVLPLELEDEITAAFAEMKDEEDDDG